MKLPNLFIVGAPKCGTTAMHTYLSLHPAIYMSIEKEPFYFHVTGEGVDNPQYHRYRGDLKKYLNLFSEATTEKYRGESSPGYLASPIAPKEIFDFNLNSKIIIMLREPADLLLSTYCHYKFMGVETRENFDDAICEEFDLCNSRENDKNLLVPCRYLELCFFSKWTKNYIDQFGKKSVHIILYDDLKKDIHKTYKKLLGFLDVDDNFIPDFKIINKRKTVRYGLLHNILSCLHLSPYHLKNSIFFNKLRKIMPFHLDISLINIGKKIYTKESSENIQCSDITIKSIREYFKNEICQLEEIVERDLSAWKGS